MSARFSIGKKFNSYAILEEELKIFQKENFVNLRKSDSHKLETKKANGKCLNFNDDLIYYDVKFVCKHYGDIRTNKNKTGQRSTKSSKINCPFHIKFTCKEGQYLECIKFDPEHNHLLSEETFKYDFTQRKLNTGDREEIEQLLNHAANRKLIASSYAKKTGKRVILKDIHNLASSTKESDFK